MLGLEDIDLTFVAEKQVGLMLERAGTAARMLVSASSQS